MSKLEQPSTPPPGNVNRTMEPDDVDATSSKFSSDGPNPPKADIIDLTIKEESPPATLIPPTQVPGSNESASGLKAGWVRFQVFGP